MASLLTFISASSIVLMACNKRRKKPFFILSGMIIYGFVRNCLMWLYRTSVEGVEFLLLQAVSCELHVDTTIQSPGYLRYAWKTKSCLFHWCRNIKCTTWLCTSINRTVPWNNFKISKKEPGVCEGSRSYSCYSSHN